MFLFSKKNCIKGADKEERIRNEDAGKENENENEK